jgi:hypothetical protein
MISSLLIFSVLGTTFQFESPDPQGPVSELVSYEISDVFLPTGFDDNDEVEVIVVGSFPDAGWQVVEVKTKRENASFDLELFARRFSGLSASVITPFAIPVKLGQLKASEEGYSIKAGSKKFGSLIIQEARNKSQRDDYLYAPVDSLRIRYEFDRGTQKLKSRILILQGYFPSACYRFVDQQPIPLIRESRPFLIEILPVMEKMNARDCDAEKETEPRDFEHEIEIPETVGSGRFLVHVRTLNGMSFNKLINLQPVEPEGNR